jgi:hypothetical protein
MKTAMDGLTTSNNALMGIACMKPIRSCDVLWNVHQHRLDDRIRRLCAKVVASSDHAIDSSVAELKAALREHNERQRKLAFDRLGRLWYSNNPTQNDQPQYDFR